MVWVKIDDHFDEHPKWADAPGDSIALWIAAMAWCNRNDSDAGFIPAFKLEGRVKVRNLKATIADLVKRDAFHPHDDGYLIHDYEEYQQPEKVKAIREQKRVAGRRGAAARWGEKARATEYAEAPAHTDAMAPAIADEMADAIPDAMADDVADVVANGWPVPRSPSSSSSVEQHPPNACLSDSVEDDDRRSGTGEDLADGLMTFDWRRGRRTTR